MTCDRFQRWVIAGAIWFLLQLVVVYQYVEYEIAHRWGVVTGTLVGFVETAPALITGLSFFPPASCRSWVERRYAPA
jgi:hypothetical protein